MIEFRQLRYFTLLAETLHYGRAAELLHITQPPLSRQISALEQGLGVQSRTVGKRRAGNRYRLMLFEGSIHTRNASMIEFRQLRYFTLLAETLHYGRAAELLHITQPPLSRQISALEQELGVQLFNRTSRTVQLTQAGEQFYRQAKALLDGLDGARRNAQATARGDQGELRLSFTMSAAWNLLPRLIKAYTAERPSVQLHLSETLPRDLQSALSSGSTDIGIAFPSHLPRHLRYQALHHEPLCAVLPADHPLAAQARIDVAQLADEPFISFPASTAPALHEALFRCCREHGFTPLIRLETHLQQTIVNLVSAGLGVALVPDSMRRMQLEGAVLRPLLDSPRIEQGLYWNGDNDNPCLPGFLDCARRLLGIQERTE